MEGLVYLCLVALLSAAQGNRVVRMSYEEVDDDGVHKPSISLINLLQPFRPSVPLTNLLQPLKLRDPKVNRLGGFKWNDCQKPSQVLKLQTLAVSPDPMKRESSEQVTIKASLSQTISSPLEGDINLEMWTGSGWVSMPCANGLGSCSVPDLCNAAPGICPLEKGDYETTKSVLIPSYVPPGSYRVTINFNYQGSWLACLQVTGDIQ